MAVEIDGNVALNNSLFTSHQQSQQRMAVIAEGGIQQLQSITNLMIQQQAGVADDSAVMAGLRTAIHVPTKGTT